MTTAKDLFEKHIDDLRKIAEEEGLHLSDVLPFIMRDGPAKESAKLGIGGAAGLGGFGVIGHNLNKNERLEMAAKKQMELYRPEFYEKTLDRVLKYPGSIWSEFPKEVLTKLEKALKASKQQKNNLAAGRAEGAKNQKEYAAKTLLIIEKINADLLKHPDTARYDLDERAEYIEKKLKEQGRKQPNGKPYLASTIKIKITGKG